MIRAKEVGGWCHLRRPQKKAENNPSCSDAEFHREKARIAFDGMTVSRNCLIWMTSKLAAAHSHLGCIISAILKFKRKSIGFHGFTYWLVDMRCRSGRSVEDYWELLGEEFIRSEFHQRNFVWTYRVKIFFLSSLKETASYKETHCGAHNVRERPLVKEIKKKPKEVEKTVILQTGVWGATFVFGQWCLLNIGCEVVNILHEGWCSPTVYIVNLLHLSKNLDVRLKFRDQVSSTLMWNSARKSHWLAYLVAVFIRLKMYSLSNLISRPTRW